MSAFVYDLEELKDGCLDLFVGTYESPILDIAERRIPGFDKKKYTDIWETASEEFYEDCESEQKQENEEHLAEPMIQYLESLNIPSFEEIALAEGYSEEEISTYLHNT